MAKRIKRLGYMDLEMMKLKFDTKLRSKLEAMHYRISSLVVARKYTLDNWLITNNNKMKLNFKLSLKPPFIICAVRKSVCSDCKGYGLMADHKWRYFKCPKCKGGGETVS